MMFGLDWVGLGWSAAAVGVNDSRSGVRTLEQGVQVVQLELPTGIILFYEGVIISISLFGCS